MQLLCSTFCHLKHKPAVFWQHRRPIQWTHTFSMFRLRNLTSINIDTFLGSSLTVLWTVDRRGSHHQDHTHHFTSQEGRTAPWLVTSWDQEQLAALAEALRCLQSQGHEDVRSRPDGVGDQNNRALSSRAIGPGWPNKIMYSYERDRGKQTG